MGSNLIAVFVELRRRKNTRSSLLDKQIRSHQLNNKKLSHSVFLLYVYSQAENSIKYVAMCTTITYLTVFSLFSSALVWGSSVKHQPQKVGKDHVLNDEDVVQIVKK